MPQRESFLPQAKSAGERAVELHARYRGKIQMLSKVPVDDPADFAVWYTPGVAEPCRKIQADPNLAYQLTNKANSVAIVSDGTRVLGLGDIGPLAGLPVMEGKALLFKYLGGVDAFPLCLATRDADELTRVVEVLQPSFGGVNLEDIAQPKCFRVLAALRERLGIPVWHDDQQGTALVVVAALQNALSCVGKSLANARIALIGVGAANVANFRLLVASGASRSAFIACDRRGILHPRRRDLQEQSESFREKWELCQSTNEAGRTGGIAEALQGADVCLAFSTPQENLIRPDWIRGMARDSIVFACANPTPEIWPRDAQAAGAAIVATGRSDLPNQVNNSLAFPGVFRGALDVRARAITDEMALAAAQQLASYAARGGLDPTAIVPRMDEIEVAVEVAVATGMAAQRLGLAERPLPAEVLRTQARNTIQSARAACQLLIQGGRIAPT